MKKQILALLLTAIVSAQAGASSLVVLLNANFENQVLVIDSKTELDIDYLNKYHAQSICYTGNAKMIPNILQKMIQKTDSGTTVQVKALKVGIESGKEVILMSLDTSTRAGNLAMASKISRCADSL